jgi:hypothetical protein
LIIPDNWPNRAQDDHFVVGIEQRVDVEQRFGMGWDDDILGATSRS